MILRIFKTSQPLSWILIVVVLVFVRLVLFVFLYQPTEVDETTNLFGLWLQQFNAFSHWLSHIISTIIVLFTGFYFNKIIQSLGTLKGINYLLVLFTGIFLSFYPADLVLSPMVITTPILLYSYYLILGSPKGNVQFGDVFNGAFFIGLSTLIYFPSSLMMLILLIALGYLSQSSWRLFIIGVIGFLTPWLFFDVLVFIFGSEQFLKINEWKTHFELPEISTFTPIKLNLGFLTLLALHLIIYFKASSHSIIRIQKALNLNFFYLIISLLIIGFLTDTEHHFIGLLVIPVSIIFTVFHLETKKWWVSDLAFIALLGLMYLNYFGI